MTSDDVIGPIYSGYVPFHPWISDCATAISACFSRLRGWRDLSDMLKRPSDIIDTRRIGIDLERNLLRRVSNRGPVSENYYEANALPLS